MFKTSFGSSREHPSSEIDNPPSMSTERKNESGSFKLQNMSKHLSNESYNKPSANKQMEISG